MTAGSDRLERSRLAILEHLHRKDQRRHPPAEAPMVSHESGEGLGGPMPHASRRTRPTGAWIDKGREAVDAWWRYHPAHVALDIARPALSAYARRKPLQYLGLAATAGVLVVLLRPWKLISVTGLLVGLVKSPQVAGMVMSALSSGKNPQDDPPTAE